MATPIHSPIQAFFSTTSNTTRYIYSVSSDVSPLRSVDSAPQGLRNTSQWQSWQRVDDLDRLLHAHWLSYPPLPYAFHVCVGVLMVTTALLAVIGNSLVLWSIFRFRSLRTSSNLFIISLALADIMMSVVDLPLFATASFMGYWPFGYYVCQFYGATTGTAGLVTIHTLAAISFDRYTVVVRHVRPIHYISKPMNLLVNVAIWIISALWVSVPLLGWSHYTLEGIGTTCTFDYMTRTTKNTSFVVVLILFCFGVPLLVILFSYSRIYMSVAAIQRGLMDLSPHIAIGRQRLRINRKIELKTASAMLIIVCVFCLSWSPYVIVSLIGLFGDVSLVTPVVSAIPCIFAKIATVSNPLIYSIGHPKFRKKIRYMLRPSVTGAVSSPTNTTDHNHVVGCDL